MIQDLKVTRGMKILDAQNRKKAGYGEERRNGEKGKSNIMKGGGEGNKEGSHCLPETSYPLFICEMRDEPLLCLQAWKLLQASRKYSDSWLCFRNSHSRKRHTDFFQNKAWRANAWGVFILLHRTTSHTHTLTFRRQALVTTCLGSTTSTRGSLMATLRMQLMSKPYTFSHPARTHTPHKIIWSGAPTWKHVRHSMRFVDFYFLNFHSLSAPAKLSVWPKKKPGRRESTTSA